MANTAYNPALIDPQATSETWQYLRSLNRQLQKAESEYNQAQFEMQSAQVNLELANGQYNIAKAEFEAAETAYNDADASKHAVDELTIFFKNRLKDAADAKALAESAAQSAYSSNLLVGYLSQTVQLSYLIGENYNKLPTSTTNLTPYPGPQFLDPLQRTSTSGIAALQSSILATENMFQALAEVEEIHTLVNYLYTGLQGAKKKAHQIFFGTQDQYNRAKANMKLREALLNRYQREYNVASEKFEKTQLALTLHKAELKAAQQSAAGIPKKKGK